MRYGVLLLMACGGAAELAPGDGSPRDFATATDLASEQDLAQAADLASAPVDLASPVDLTPTPPDLISTRDLTGCRTDVCTLLALCCPNADGTARACKYDSTGSTAVCCYPAGTRSAEAWPCCNVWDGVFCR